MINLSATYLMNLLVSDGVFVFAVFDTTMLDPGSMTILCIETHATRSVPKSKVHQHASFWNIYKQKSGKYQYRGDLCHGKVPKRLLDFVEDLSFRC